MIYKQFDVVVVPFPFPFPFTELNAEKRRPALVLSTGDFNEQSENCILAMITSQNNPKWPLDIRIGSLQKAGLKAPSMIRMKFFTLDNRLIIKKLGGLSGKDQESVKKTLQTLMDL